MCSSGCDLRRRVDRSFPTDARAKPGRPEAAPQAAPQRARLTRWLLIRGRGSNPLDAVVRREEIKRHSSSKRPSVQAGDRAILYAAVWQAIFGVVEVTGDPEQDPERERWSWRFPIRPLTVLRDLREAPPVEAAGVFPQSIWRHSHIRLSEEQFTEACRLIEDAA